MDKPGITLTIKGDGAAPWLVFNLDGPESLEQAIGSVPESLLVTAAELSVHFTAACRVAQGTAPAPVFFTHHPDVVPEAPQPATERAQTAWSQTTPAPNTAQPQPSSIQGGPVNGQSSPTGATCGLCNSVLTFKGGIAKNTGKPYAMWACPNGRNRDDGHRTDWVG